MHGTASHGKETRNPHRSKDPMVMVAGLRSREIIGLCRIALLGAWANSLHLNNLHPRQGARMNFTRFRAVADAA